MEFYIFIMIEPYIIYSTVCLSFRHFELNTFINLNVLEKKAKSIIIHILCVIPQFLIALK